ncbi:MAG TPA: ABC transporter substrate-binding protein [Thermoleophilia bacterium]|nr:ABC transporter substrate-binding protein [Thermoleophilia bacterium]
MSQKKGRLPRYALVALAVVMTVAVLASVAAAASESPTPALISAAPEPSSSGSSTSMVRIGQLQTVDNLNPFVGIQGLDYQIWHLNYDFLVGFDSQTLAPRPELATNWTHSADGKTWTFQTRQNVTWQDGQPFTAEDVAFTFNYIVKNQLANLAVYTDGITGAKATGPNTVEVYTKAPKANMLRMVVPILPEHIWSKISGKAAAGSFQNNPPIVGTGPYQVVELNKGKGSFVHLVANPHYWGGAPKVHDLYIMTYTNADTMTADLKIGTIDAAVDTTPAQFKTLSSTPGITTNTGTAWQFTELGFNCYDSPNSKGNPVLLDPKFRQALEWAVDRQKVVDTAFYGYAKVGSTLIVPYSSYHWQPPADQLYTYDPAKANQLLDAAGYKDVNNDGYRETKQGKPLSLRLMVTTDSPANQVTGKFVVNWFKNVGVKAVLSVVDSGVLINAQYNYVGNTYAPDYDMYIWYWTQDVDPAFMVSIYTPAQIEGWNDCLWTDPQYTKLSNQQAQTIDEAKRIPLVQQAQQIFYESSPYIIFSYPAQLEAWNTDKWTGWTKAPAGDGAAIYNYNNIDTYKNLAPNIASESSGTPVSLWIAIAAVAVAAVVVLIVVMRRRGHGQAVEA